MAFLLSSERPAVAPVGQAPLRVVLDWFRKMRATRAQRLALSELLEYDAARLDDLGINRHDLFEAINRSPRLAGRTLSERRAQRASIWRAHQAR